MKAAAAADASDAIAEQAARWIVQLSADDEAEREQARAGFDAWVRADPRHAEAAAGMQGFIGQVRAHGAAGHAAIRAAFAPPVAAAGRRVRRITAALGIALALALPTWLALRTQPASYLMADLRSAPGQWAEHTLPDGTRITLGSHSAINLRYDASLRRIELVQGEVLLDVAKDAARPLVVETPHGRMRALGTRFVAGRSDEHSVLSVLESRVAASASAAPGEPVVVQPGQRVRIRAEGVGPIESVDVRSVSDAWQHHQLLVSNRPLTEVLA